MAFIGMSYISRLLSSVIETVITEVVKVLAISGLIGSYVVHYATILVLYAHYSIDTTFTVLRILYEDFMVFFQDVVGICAVISHCLMCLLNFIFETIVSLLIDLRDAIFYVLMLPILIYYCVISVFESVLLCAVNAAELFKSALTLIGTSIWVALMFIPNSVLNITLFTVSECNKVANYTYELSRKLINAFFSGLCDGAFKMVYFFVDVPCEAFGGLAAGLLLMWIIYKKQNAINCFGVRIYLLHLKAVTMLIQLVRSPCRYLIHQVNVYRRHFLFRRRGLTSQSCVADDMLQGNEFDAIPGTSLKGVNSKDWLKLKKKLEKELEEKLCSVCQEKRKTVIVLPCRHLCMCEDCVLIVERINRKCPLCRRHIGKTMIVYL